MLLPKQAISYKQLRKEGYSESDIKGMYSALKLFPTPFKGIYYIPTQEERLGLFIERPSNVLSQSIELFLKSPDFYFSCGTAEEQLGISWRPSGIVHVVNTKVSRKIALGVRARRNIKKGSRRAIKVAKLISFFGNELVFHRVKSIEGAKTRRTPYGIFALRSQIRKDKKRFGELKTVSGKVT